MADSEAGYNLTLFYITVIFVSGVVLGLFFIWKCCKRSKKSQIENSSSKVECDSYGLYCVYNSSQPHLDELEIFNTDVPAFDIINHGPQSACHDIQQNIHFESQKEIIGQLNAVEVAFQYRRQDPYFAEDFHLIDETLLATPGTLGTQERTDHNRLTTEPTISRNSVQLSTIVNNDFDLTEMQNIYNRCLQKHSGTMESTLKPLQALSIHKMLLGKDVLTILRTNYGKSLAMILPTFIMAKMLGESPVCILILPLTTLMDDFLRKFRMWNLPAKVMSKPVLKSGETAVFLDSLLPDSPAYLLSSPETVRETEFRTILTTRNITQIIIDEIQTTVDWAPKFRTDFGMLHDIRNLVDAPIGLYTATISKDMIQSAIIHTGIMKNNLEIVADSADRPEIFLRFEKRLAVEESLKFLVDEAINLGVKMPRTLLFVDAVQQTHQINVLFRSFLPNKGRVFVNGELTDYLSDHFSASTEPKARARILSTFANPSSCLTLLISTCSYGLGMDNKTIRRVVVYDTDKSPTSLWQKIGRACRDGEQGEAVIMTRGREGGNFFGNTNCIRRGILSSFVGYTASPVMELCICKKSNCNCQRCKCCSLCRQSCSCYNTPVLDNVQNLADSNESMEGSSESNWESDEMETEMNDSDDGMDWVE